MRSRGILSLIVWLPAAALALGALSSACTRHSSLPASPDALEIQLPSEPVSLDPALAEDGISLRILNNTMDGLVGYDSNGQLEPRIAQTMKFLDGGKRMEFTLRKATWSDGVPLVSADFVRGLKRALDPKTGSKLASLLAPIASVEAPASDRLVIRLKRPAPYMIQALAISAALPYREPWSRTGPVTGPYRIAEYVPEQFIRLEANTAYWNHTGRELPTIVLRIVRDESTALSLFEQGKIDILTRVPSYDIDRLSKKGELRVEPYMATYFVAFNTRKPPFSDKTWRQAVSGSINREELVAALGTGEKPALSWIPPGLEGFEPYVNPEPLFAAAARKVAGTWSAPVVAGFDSSERNSTVMEKIQADLAHGLKLKLDLQNRDWKSFVSWLSSDPPPIYRFGCQAPFRDPIFHLRFFTSGDPNNYTGWKNAEYDRLVDRIAELAPGRERDRLIERAQRILVRDEAVVVPILHYVQTHAVSDRVMNFRANPFGVVRFNELRIGSH